MQILRLREVKRVFGHRSDSSIYDAIRKGLFPTGVAIGRRARGWPATEVQVIFDARIAGVDEDELRKIVSELHTSRPLRGALLAATQGLK